MLEEERLNITSQLASKREEALLYSRDLIQLKQQFALMEGRCRETELEIASSRSSLTQLEIEKELRARCEIREENERRERVAAIAQAMAMESECNNRIRTLEDASRKTIDELTNEIYQLKRDRDDVSRKLHDSDETIMGLENEVKSLKKAIDHASANQNTEAVKQLGKITGELEIMRRRVQELTEQQVYLIN
jgi:PDZ domain-containing secreted protein